MNQSYFNQQKFWEGYYKRFAFHHSPFAEFCLQFLKVEETLIDIGCGRGQDSLFFLKNGLYVVALDWVKNKELELLSSDVKKDLLFMKKSIVDLEDLPIQNMYLRFLLHSITEEEETFLFEWAKKFVSRKLFVETRSIKDPKGSLVENNIYKTDHCRRFIDVEVLKSKVEALGFNILYLKEDRGFALSSVENKYSINGTSTSQNNEDPILIRLVAEKIK